MGSQPIFGWRWIGVLIGVVITPIAANILFFGDFGLFLLLLFSLPLLTAAAIVSVIVSAFFGRRWFVRISALVIAAGIAVTICFLGGVRAWVPIREDARWLAASAHHKALLLAQPEAADGELKHIEWDGWGMAGQDTSVFLVFDPADRLATAAASGQSGKFVGLPCSVWFVQRLEKQWYSVVFFTNTYWGACGDDDAS